MKANKSNPERPHMQTSLLRKRLIRTLFLFCLVAGAGAAVVTYTIEKQGRTPREWAPYLVRRAEGNNPLIVGATKVVGRLLDYMDRVPDRPPRVQLAWFGAKRDAVAGTGPNRANALPRLVGSMDSLIAALNDAEPGDIIELLPGRYSIEGRGIQITRPGKPGAPITLRAAQLGQVVIESAVIEAIKVFVPDWHFENLVIRGACRPQDDSYCDHAFHIVGNAKETVIRNNFLVDFNAQIKINGEDGQFPDNGIIDRNTLTDSRARATPNPVTPIDLDAASGWQITSNLITDFIKSEGNGISYGGFAKAAGENNVFERNVVLCENQFPGERGQRIGLSLGGGGSNESIRRDNGRSGLEQNNSKISDNLIAFCSDMGIYVNRAMNSQIFNNTILDTSGIEVRFPQSLAKIDSNIIDGIIALRDDATVYSSRNRQASLLGLFVGWHPQRRLFVDVAHFDLRWRGSPPRDDPAPDSLPDLCGATRPSQPAIGAFEDFSACLSRTAN
jgi:parallel beta-helix repeat protein